MCDRIFVVGSMHICNNNFCWRFVALYLQVELIPYHLFIIVKGLNHMILTERWLIGLFHQICFHDSVVADMNGVLVVQPRL